MFFPVRTDEGEENAEVLKLVPEASNIRYKSTSSQVRDAAVPPVALIKSLYLLYVSRHLLFFSQETNIRSFTYVHIHKNKENNRVFCYLSCLSGKL